MVKLSDKWNTNSDQNVTYFLTRFLLCLYHLSVMSDHLPSYIDPIALVDKRARLRGILPIIAMARIQEELLACDEGTKIDLSFQKDGRIAIIAGSINADITLQCQCCLKPMVINIERVVSLAVASSIDEAQRLPERYEPLLMSSEKIALSELVEDELLLALPMIAQHDHCELTGLKPVAEPESGDKTETKENPFAILKQLRKTGE